MTIFINFSLYMLIKRGGETVRLELLCFRVNISMISEFHKIFLYSSVSAVPCRSSQYYFVSEIFHGTKWLLIVFGKLAVRFSYYICSKALLQTWCSNNLQVTGTSLEWQFFSNNGSHKKWYGSFYNFSAKVVSDGIMDQCRCEKYLAISEYHIN